MAGWTVLEAEESSSTVGHALAVDGGYLAK